MNVLDELRKQMHGRQVGSMGALDNFTENTRRKAWEQAIAILDALEAARPGLIDKTVNCENCGTPAPRYYSDGSTGTMLNPGWAYIWTTPGDKYDDGAFLDADIWFVCPACVEEATP